MQLQERMCLMITRNPRGLLSVGYQGRTLNELLSQLVAEEVETLVDVRLTPISRKPGMSRAGLSAALHSADITYLHFPVLGNPRDNREPFRRGDIAQGSQIFREVLRNEEPAAALAEIVSLSRQHLVALLCYERQAARCHRQVIIDEVVRCCIDLPVRHLD
jgi:uncharacterized protein (DUF488 family)